MQLICLFEALRMVSPYQVIFDFLLRETYVFVVSRFFIWTYSRKQVFNWPENSKNYYATQFLFVNYQVLKERASESNFLGDANNLQFDPFGKQLFFSKPKICSKYILKKVSNGCYPHQSSNAKCIYIKLPFN